MSQRPGTGNDPLVARFRELEYGFEHTLYATVGQLSTDTAELDIVDNIMFSEWQQINEERIVASNDAYEALFSLMRTFPNASKELLMRIGFLLRMGTYSEFGKHSGFNELNLCAIQTYGLNNELFTRHALRSVDYSANSSSLLRQRNVVLPDVGIEESSPLVLRNIRVIVSDNSSLPPSVYTDIPKVIENVRSSLLRLLDQPKISLSDVYPHLIDELSAVDGAVRFLSQLTSLSFMEELDEINNCYKLILKIIGRTLYRNSLPTLIDLYDAARRIERFGPASEISTLEKKGVQDELFTMKALLSLQSYLAKTRQAFLAGVYLTLSDNDLLPQNERRPFIVSQDGFSWNLRNAIISQFMKNRPPDTMPRTPKKKAEAEIARKLQIEEAKAQAPGTVTPTKGSAVASSSSSGLQPVVGNRAGKKTQARTTKEQLEEQAARQAELEPFYDELRERKERLEAESMLNRNRRRNIMLGAGGAGAVAAATGAARAGLLGDTLKNVSNNAVSTVSNFFSGAPTSPIPSDSILKASYAIAGSPAAAITNGTSSALPSFVPIAPVNTIASALGPNAATQLFNASNKIAQAAAAPSVVGGTSSALTSFVPGTSTALTPFVPSSGLVPFDPAVTASTGLVPYNPSAAITSPIDAAAGEPGYLSSAFGYVKDAVVNNPATAIAVAGATLATAAAGAYYYRNRGAKPTPPAAAAPKPITPTAAAILPPIQQQVAPAPMPARVLPKPHLLPAPSERHHATSTGAMTTPSGRPKKKSPTGLRSAPARGRGAKSPFKTPRSPTSRARTSPLRAKPTGRSTTGTPGRKKPSPLRKKPSPPRKSPARKTQKKSPLPKRSSAGRAV